MNSNDFGLIKTKLGKPYFEDNNFILYNDDCIFALNKLSEPIFDLTVTSPPYNIGKSYEKVVHNGKYIDWSHQWINAVYKNTKKDGAFWLNLGYFSYENRAKAVPIIYLLWDKIPFYLIQEIVWHYEAGVLTKKSLAPRNEKFLWYVKNPDAYVFNLDSIRDPNVKYPNQKKNGKLKCNPLGKNPGDVWLFPKVTSGANRSSKERTSHPAQFPIAVINRIIKACSNENQIILDPFMGSGTTAEAALRLKRKVVGFEILREYCDIAVKRYEKAKTELGQLPLLGMKS
ncbi:MAG: site-specific DNA-methyltransferase [Patescibacteria group bacterium]